MSLMNHLIVNGITAKNEKELETTLCIILKKNGWCVERQVSSDEKGKTNRPLFRTDLIIYHKDHAELGLVGIELKYLRQVRCGGKFGKHLLQILKYRDCHFNGRKINTWVFGAYFEDRKHTSINDEEAKIMIQTSQVYTSQLLNQFGIGWLNLNSFRFKIEFANNNSKLKINLEKPIEWYHYDHKPDYEKIKKLINDRRVIKAINYYKGGDL